MLRSAGALDVHEYGGRLNPLEASGAGATPDDHGTTHLRCGRVQSAGPPRLPVHLKQRQPSVLHCMP